MYGSPAGSRERMGPLQEEETEDKTTTGGRDREQNSYRKKGEI